MILQTNNGREFSGAASTSKQRRSDRQNEAVGSDCHLSGRFVDEVITEVRKLWPGSHMVRGSPRHSESNGGVERVNCTVQQKLHSWMKRHKSMSWST